MVRLYVNLRKQDETFWLEHPLGRKTKMTLLRCMFKNGLYNLTGEGLVYDAKKRVVLRIPEGNYNLVTFTRALSSALTLGEPSLKIKANEKGVTYATANEENMTLSPNLASLLGVPVALSWDGERKKSYKISIKETPSVLHLHCNLVNSFHTLSDEKRNSLSYRTFGSSQVLSLISVGRPGRNISYTFNDTIAIPILGEKISSIRFWVTDINNEGIPDGVYPLSIALEIT